MKPDWWDDTRCHNCDDNIGDIQFEVPVDPCMCGVRAEGDWRAAGRPVSFTSWIRMDKAIASATGKI